MHVEVSIVGYDRQSERLAVEHPIPLVLSAIVPLRWVE